VRDVVRRYGATWYVRRMDDRCENTVPAMPSASHFAAVDFRDLRAWQESLRLAAASRDAILKLPPSERFALAAQWRRATYSVSLNIAEGASRRGPREFRRYLDIARSSLHEIEAILALVQALGYLTESELATVATTRDNCARMVYGLLRKVSDRPSSHTRTT